MTHYRVHLESSAAVGVEIAVEAANEDEAAQAVERMLSNGQLDPYALVDELLKPSQEATLAYAKRTGQPITYITVELDENGYEIVDEFEPTLEESVLQTLEQHHVRALGSDAAYPDDPATKLAKDLVQHGNEYLAADYEPQRLKLLAEVDNPDNYKPGTFGCHEALHVASVLSSHVEDDLLTHPAIIQNPDWYARASRALEELFDLYQGIGTAHITPHEEGERQLTVSGAEHATILAALRFWQANGQGDPANRKDEFHEIATNADQVISLDDKGIDELCERINA